MEAYRQGVEDARSSAKALPKLCQRSAKALSSSEVCDSAAIWAFEADELQELMCGAGAPQWTEQDEDCLEED